MALARAASLGRLALRSRWAAAPWAAARLLSSGEREPERVIDLGQVRHSRALRPPAAQTGSTSRAASTRDRAWLIKAFAACGDFSALLDLVSQHTAALDAVNALVALVKLSKLLDKRAAGGWLKDDARLPLLLNALPPCFAQAEPKRLAIMLATCGKLVVRPPAAWLRSFWDACSAKMASFELFDLAGLLSGCGHLGLNPPADALLRYWQLSGPVLGELKDHELASALLVCGRLHSRPPAEWLRLFWEASLPKLEHFDQQSLVRCIQACGKLGIRPPPAWLQAACDVSCATMGDFTPQSLCNVLQAFGQLKLRPPDEWLLRWFDVSAPKLSDFNKLDLSGVLPSCASLGVKPPADWLKRYWALSAAMLGAMDRQAVAKTRDACLALGIELHPSWARRYEREKQVPKYVPQPVDPNPPTRQQIVLNEEILACLNAAAVLDLVVPQLATLNRVNASAALFRISKLASTPDRTAALKDDARFAQLLTAVEALLGDMEPRQLNNTLYAFGKLRVMPSAHWLERFWERSGTKLDEFDPQAVCNSLYTCGLLAITPPDAWLLRYWEASAPKLSICPTPGLMGILTACGKLGIKPPDDWLQALWKAVRFGELWSLTVADALAACQKLGVQPRDALAQRHARLLANAAAKAAAAEPAAG
jgi:hypothetical protein